jgi:hypothetical protein
MVAGVCVAQRSVARRLLKQPAMPTNRAATVLPALLLAAAAATAHADTVQVASATPAPAPAAPQTDGWNDLSHINGQLVKVGEKNDYRKAYKRTIISTNPVGWILGSYGVSLSHGLNDHIAIRGDINYLSNWMDEDISGLEVGIGAPIYFRRTYQGVFLEPGIISRRFDSEGQTEVTAAGPQMLVGWHWTWDSGLNVAIAGGIGRNWSTDSEYEEKIFGNGYLRFGYAF